MYGDRHVRADHYVLSRQDEGGRGGLALHVHEHLVQVCRDCAEAWRLLGEEERRAYRDLLLRAPPPEDAAAVAFPPHHRAAYSWEARRVEQEVEEIRSLQSEACKRGWELLHLPPEERPERLRRAWTRFRSRVEAEYVLGKARECIREDPREAESLAATAALIVGRIPGAAGTAWAAALEARARAWRANALRVAGDLPAAGEAFARLRRDLATAPLDDAGVVGEVASLEASLRIDLRQFGEAHERLDLARAIAGLLGDGGLEARVLVKKGNLHALEGQDLKALHCFESAAVVGPEGEDSDLVIVNGQVGSLCNLGRFREAARLLDFHLDLYENSDRLYAGAVLRYHRGRIALGEEQWEEAARHLRDARQVFLDLDRGYDAALATLDLAWVLVHRGGSRSLHALATPLVPLFASRRVHRETLASVRLLVDALREDRLSAERLAELRHRLRRDLLVGSAVAEAPGDTG